MEGRKFVCKYCSKRFPCGKSLGGHIRTHMMNEANEEKNIKNYNNANANAMFKFDAFCGGDGGRKRKKDLLLGGSEAEGVGVGNPIYYGLRENPKKTMRFVHCSNTNNNNNANFQQQLDNKFCKECGKGFPSLKALCGHMACHSEKEKGGSNNYRFFENSSGISEKQKLVMDSQSDTETSSAPMIRRSKRMTRFKNLSSNNNNNNNHTNQYPPCSSSVSEVEQEQEEVARCLMMLSKDNSYIKGRFALFTESSDNNSVVLEAKSPSVDTKVLKNYVSNGYGVVEEEDEKKKNKKLLHKDMNLKKLKCDEIDYDSDNSDSGYFRYGPKKVDSDDSNEGFFRNEVKAGFGDYDVESRKMLSRGRSRNSVFKKLVLEEEEEENSRMKKPSYDSVGQNLIGVISKKKSNGFAIDEIRNKHGGEKSWKYECNGSDYSAYESDENSTDTDSYPAPPPPKPPHGGKKPGKGKKKPSKSKKSKKSKEHECPICNRMFRSGQALGGHKRSHFVGGSEENTLVIRPGPPPPLPPPPPVHVPCIIDLNLPAPFDE